MPQKKFKVLNPNDIPKGVPLMEFQGKEWKEGDEFVRPTTMSDYGFQRLISQGHIVEVRSG